MAVEMELVGIEMERPPNIPCLLLREADGERRVLPIFIGGPEATAIAFALEEVETPRPMTHDLMKDLLDELGARIERVVITDLRDATFYADIVLSSAGTVHSVSARPSDAVALAVRYGAPVFAGGGRPRRGRPRARCRGRARRDRRAVQGVHRPGEPRRLRLVARAGAGRPLTALMAGRTLRLITTSV